MVLALFGILSFATLDQKSVSALARDPLAAGYLTSQGAISIAITGDGLADLDRVLLNNSLTTTSGEITYYNFEYRSVAYAKDSLKDDEKEDRTKQCTIYLKIVVASTAPGTGRMYVSQGSRADTLDPDGSSSMGSCDSGVLAEAKKKFDQKDIPLVNVQIYDAFIGQSGGEQPFDRVVSGTAKPLIDAESFEEIDESKVPENDTIRLKTAAGTELQVTTVNVIIGSPPSSSVGYPFTFSNVDPGEYQVCSDLLKSETFSGCKSFTKQLGTAARGVNITGDASTQLTVKTDSSAQGDGAQSCENVSGLSLSWIICGVLRFLDSIVSWADNQIYSLLHIPPEYYNNGSLRATWANFRNLAYLILVPVMLVMVLGTALGFEFVSAYTVKKLMPKLVAAVILIALSYDISVFAIELTESLGRGLAGLMGSTITLESSGAPAYDVTLRSLFNPGGVEGGLVFTGIIAGLGTALVAGSLGILFSYALVMVVTLVVVFLLLAFRQMLLLMLLIFAPIAVLFFPISPKLWNFWKGSFTKLLMLYPIIIILITGGRMFAVLVDNTNLYKSGGDNGIIGVILKLSAYILPYFFIPFVFKYAGGVFANIAGMANNRERGLFDRQKKYRGKKTAQNFADTRAGNRFRSNNALSNRASAVLGYGANLNRAGLNPRNMRRNMQAALAERDLVGMQENMEKNTAFKPFIGNDDLLAAATHGRGTEADARAYLTSRGQSGRDLEQNLAHIAAAKKSMGDRQFAMAAAVANGGTGTGYSGGPGEMLEAIQRASGGDMALAGNMLAMAKGKAEGARRYDLSGAGYGDMYGQLQAIGRANSTGGTAAAVAHANDFLTDRALDVQGPGAALAGRGRSVQNLIPAMQRRIQRSVQNMNDIATGHAPMLHFDNQGRRVEEASSPDRDPTRDRAITMEEAQRSYDQNLASTSALHDVAAQVAPENGRMLADGLLNVPMDTTGLHADVRSFIGLDPSGTSSSPAGTLFTRLEARRGSEDFQQIHRELTSQYQQQYQQTQQAVSGTGMTGATPPIGTI